MINITNLSKKYEGHWVLNKVSFDIAARQNLALIGPNGSGKTTLIKCIMGLALPESGEIRIKGKSIISHYDYKKDIGYMPQISRFPENMQVQHLFSFMKGLRSVKKGTYDLELYEQFEIEKMKNKRLANLSGGMRQKVSAALAFLFSPSLIILDEPTAGLDPLSNMQLKNKINKVSTEGKLTIITSHILNDLDDIASHVIYLMDGKVKFYQDLPSLRNDTREKRLNNIIVKYLNKGRTDGKN
jgi:Cu-processing system ATP-binding protein